MIRRTFLATGLAASLASATHAQQRSVAGVYVVNGRNRDGTSYSGSLRLSELKGRIVGEWNISGQKFRASGRLEGRLLILHWEDGQPPVHYVVMRDGALHGTWDDGFALERATPR